MACARERRVSSIRLIGVPVCPACSAEVVREPQRDAVPEEALSLPADAKLEDGRKFVHIQRRLGPQPALLTLAVCGQTDKTKDNTIQRKASVVKGNCGDWVKSAGCAASCEWEIEPKDHHLDAGCHGTSCSLGCNRPSSQTSRTRRSNAHCLSVQSFVPPGSPSLPRASQSALTTFEFLCTASCAWSN